MRDLEEPAEEELLFRFLVPGYEEGTVTIPASATESQILELALEPLELVRGRVISAATGEPMEGVTILVITREYRPRVQLETSREHLKEHFAGIQATTGPDGTFEVTRIPTLENALLVLLGPGVTFHVIRYADVELANGYLELSFPALSLLRGSVIVNGKPIPRERVRIDWQPLVPFEREFPFEFCRNLVTDEKGRFRFERLAPGKYRLSRLRPLGGSAQGYMCKVIQTEDVLVLPGREVTQDLVQSGGYDLEGRTLDREGHPFGNCKVRLLEGSVPSRHRDIVRSDRQGHFSIPCVPSGRYTLTAEYYSGIIPSASESGNDFFRGSKEVVVSGPMKADIELRCQE